MKLDIRLNRERRLNLKIWIDSDACPIATQEAAVKFGERNKIEIIVTGGDNIPDPGSTIISDDRSSEKLNTSCKTRMLTAEHDDIFITSDAALAARLVENGGVVVNPSGRKYDEQTARERLSFRGIIQELNNHMDELKPYQETALENCLLELIRPEAESGAEKEPNNAITQ